MRKFQYSVSYSGNSQLAINAALQTLLPLGFHIVEQSDNTLTVEGPGYNSTRQNALMGMSHGIFNFSRSIISIKAILEGVDHISRFLLFLFLGIGAFNALIFTGLWFYIDTLHANLWFLAFPAAITILWGLIAPVITLWIRKRCEEAITNLLQNMAALA